MKINALKRSPSLKATEDLFKTAKAYIPAVYHSEALA